MISENFKCSLCSQFLADPIKLQCGPKQCGSHSRILSLYESCHLCKKYACKRKKISDSEIAEKLKFDPILAITEAKETVRRMSNTDPDYIAYEYFEDLKRQVDLKREKLKIELDEYSDKLIEAITKTQAESMELAKNVRKDGIALDETLANEIKEIVEEYETMAINEEDFEKFNRQLLVLKFKCDKMLEEYQKSILSEKYVLETDTYINISELFGKTRIEKRNMVSFIFIILYSFIRNNLFYFKTKV